MEETQTTSAPLVYSELSKEQKRDLQKEYSKTPEAKKTNRWFIALVVLFAAVFIAGAVTGFASENEAIFTTIPVVFICILPATISQGKYEKWLAAEKNIIMKREKQPKA